MGQDPEDESSHNDWTMGTVACQFGPNNSVYLRCRSRWTWWYQGQASDEIEGLSIETPYIVALLSNGGWFVCYKNLEGDVKWNFIYFREAQNTQMWNGDGEKQWHLRSKMRDPYTTLSSWLSENMILNHEQQLQSTVVFGPGDSYYARSGKSCVWNNLPKDLETQIVKGMGQGKGGGPPKTVTLGAGLTWIALWDNGRRSWNLGHNYNEVHERLLNDDRKMDDDDGIVSVTLSPYNDNFFIHYRNGHLHWRFSGDEEKRKNFRKIAFQYMQIRAREDNTTFRCWAFSDPSLFKYNVVISPTSKYDRWDGFTSPLNPRFWISGGYGDSNGQGARLVLFGAAAVSIGAGATLLMTRGQSGLNTNNSFYERSKFFKQAFKWFPWKRR